MAAAVFDTSVSYSSTSAATTHTTAAMTISSAADRVLYVKVATGAGTPQIPTAVKCGGSGGTACTQISTTLSPTNGKHTLWRLIAPPTGSQTIYASWATGQDEVLITAETWTNADQVTPNGTVITGVNASGTNFTPSVAAASIAGDMVSDSLFVISSNTDSKTLTVGAGQTSIQEIEGLATGGYEDLGASYETASGTSTTMSWSIGGTSSNLESTMFAFAINGASSSASATSSRRKKRLIFPGQHAGPFGARIRTRRYNTAAALPTITGDLATTNTNDTSAATGTPIVNGSAAPTNAADASTASGVVWAQAASRRAKTPIHPGAGPYNLLRFKRSARNNTVSNAVTGTLAATNANDTSAASGTPTVNGSAAPTNANDTLSAAGTTTVIGSLAKTNGNDTSAASGTPTVNGSAAPTNGNDTLSAAGTTTVAGTLAKTNANDSIAAQGTTTVTGSLATTNADDSLAASGTAGAVVGTLAVTEGADTLSAAGVATSAQTGGGAVIVDLPKKRGRKAKKAQEADSEATKPIDQPRVISEEEAQGMAAIYGIPEKQPEIERDPPQEPDIFEANPPEVDPTSALEPFPIPASVYGAESAQAPAAVQVQEEDGIDEIALILAIIEAIG